MAFLDAANEARSELDSPFCSTPLVYAAYHVFLWVLFAVPNLTLAVVPRLFAAGNNSARSS
jgi:hypothetical protein